MTMDIAAHAGTDTVLDGQPTGDPSIAQGEPAISAETAAGQPNVGTQEPAQTSNDEPAQLDPQRD